MQLEIPRCLWNGRKSYNVWGHYAQAKINVFYQLTMFPNNIVLTSYLSSFYWELWFSWLWVGVQKTLKERRKQTEEKYWKVKRKTNGEYEESQITKIYIFSFKLYFARKYCLKKLFYLQFLCVAGYLKHSDIWNTLINRLITATQIFIAMDYSIQMWEKYLHFSNPVEVIGFMYFGNIFRIITFLKICTRTWKKLE